jgi:apolipoprotein N-acyltransferase
MNKIGQYFNTFDITRGLLISIALSSFIYLHEFNLSYPLINTLIGLFGLFFLLRAKRGTWFWSGIFIGLFWFWWIMLSFKHYHMLWAIPLVLIGVALIYSVIFWFIAVFSEKLASFSDHYGLPLELLLKSVGLLSLSTIHPFGFDWLKPELIFVESYIGITKWQFAIVLLAMTLLIWRVRLMYLALIIFAYQPLPKNIVALDNRIQIVSTDIPVEVKWKRELHPQHFQTFFQQIDNAIKTHKRIVILPESVFPVFINRSEYLKSQLKKRAQNITIVTGGLYLENQIPKNSTYIFTKDRIQIADKVLLVPFGESNPLPDILSDWVNEVFYDGAVDYVASADIMDYTIGDTTYRNAICFEATSERLYEGTPENMIVLSNNGWFIPSIEPTLQKLLLLYYNKKYGTTIYHSINRSPSYIIKNGNIIPQEDH